MSDSVRPHRRQPTRLHRPWDSLGKITGVGCHFLLQCMKVKSESEVAQSCPTLSDPMDCSPPGSSIHGVFQARVLEWGAIAFSIKNYKASKRKIISLLPRLGILVFFFFLNNCFLVIKVNSLYLKCEIHKKPKEKSQAFQMALSQFSRSVVSDSLRPHESQHSRRSEERRVGKECRSRWSPYH